MLPEQNVEAQPEEEVQPKRPRTKLTGRKPPAPHPEAPLPTIRSKHRFRPESRSVVGILANPVPTKSCRKTRWISCKSCCWMNRRKKKQNGWPNPRQRKKRSNCSCFNWVGALWNQHSSDRRNHPVSSNRPKYPTQFHFWTESFHCEGKMIPVINGRRRLGPRPRPNRQENTHRGAE